MLEAAAIRPCKCTNDFGAVSKNVARPIKYHSPEEKREASRASWRKYNEGHHDYRCEANREYVQRPLVKARIHEMRKVTLARLPKGPVAVVVPGAFKLDRAISPLEKREAPECLPEADNRRVLPPKGLGTEQCQPTTP